MAGAVSGFPGVTGWLPDTFDDRDHPFRLPYIPIKPSVNLRTDKAYAKYWDSPYDQLMLNSCVANAACPACRFEVKKEAATGGRSSGKYLPNVIEPSRNFVYYNARFADNTLKAKKEGMTDNGCCNRNALKSIHQLGVCAESINP
jgi:hypothetical protein